MKQAVHLILYVGLLLGAFWWLIRPEPLPTEFSAALPEYLALSSARDAPFDFLAPDLRAEVLSNPGHRRVLLETRYPNRGKSEAEGPVVIVDPKAKQIARWHLALPDDLRAREPGQVKSVLWLECEYKEIGSYTRGGKAFREECAATLFDFRRKVWVWEDSFTGEDPPDTIVNKSSGFGSVPSAKIEGWLRDLLKPTGTSK